jgi:hypothetical protein
MLPKLPSILCPFPSGYLPVYSPLSAPALQPKDFARIQTEIKQYKESLGIIGSDKRSADDAFNSALSVHSLHSVTVSLLEYQNIGY